MEKEKKKDNKVSRVIRILLVVFLLVVFIYHRIMLKKEAPLREPLGQMVEVDNQKNEYLHRRRGRTHTNIYVRFRDWLTDT